MSWRAWLLMLAALAVFATAWRRCSHRLLVGDFPPVERSSRGLALAMLPHVAALVAPSARVRTRANRGTRQGLSRTLRRSQCRACWPPSRWISRRYRSAQRPERVRAWSVRERCESPEVARPHLRSANGLWAGWRPPRCRKPGMQATVQAHRRPARRYQGAERGLACVQDARRYCHRSALTLVRRYRSSGFCAQFSDGREARSREDFDDHVPPGVVTMRWHAASSSQQNTLKLRLEYCNQWEH